MSLKKFIKRWKDYELSDSDIRDLTGLNVVTYDKLVEYPTLESLVDNDKQAVVVLYLSSWNSGHYVLVYKDKYTGVISFFDSYGFGIDHELAFMPFYIDKGGMPLLKALANNYTRRTGIVVNVSHYQLQSDKLDTSTCGAWCVMRFFLAHHTHEEFNQLFRLKALTPDDILTLFMYLPLYHLK